jgi:hypothetical protein
MITESDCLTRENDRRCPVEIDFASEVQIDMLGFSDAQGGLSFARG